MLFFERSIVMPLDPRVKKNWEEIQKKFDFPVNAIGVRIADKDQKALQVWKEENIDKFMKK